MIHYLNKDSIRSITILDRRPPQISTHWILTFLYQHSSRITWWQQPILVNRLVSSIYTMWQRWTRAARVPSRVAITSSTQRIQIILPSMHSSVRIQQRPLIRPHITLLHCHLSWIPSFRHSYTIDSRLWPGSERRLGFFVYNWFCGSCMLWLQLKLNIISLFFFSSYISKSNKSLWLKFKKRTLIFIHRKMEIICLKKYKWKIKSNWYLSFEKKEIDDTNDVRLKFLP